MSDRQVFYITTLHSSKSNKELIDENGLLKKELRRNFDYTVLDVTRWNEVKDDYDIEIPIENDIYQVLIAFSCQGISYKTLYVHGIEKVFDVVQALFVNKTVGLDAFLNMFEVKMSVIEDDRKEIKKSQDKANLNRQISSESEENTYETSNKSGDIYKNSPKCKSCQIRKNKADKGKTNCHSCSGNILSKSLNNYDYISNAFSLENNLQNLHRDWMQVDIEKSRQKKSSEDKYIEKRIHGNENKAKHTISIENKLKEVKFNGNDTVFNGINVKPDTNQTFFESSSRYKSIKKGNEVSTCHYSDSVVIDPSLRFNNFGSSDKKIVLFVERKKLKSNDFFAQESAILESKPAYEIQKIKQSLNSENQSSIILNKNMSLPNINEIDKVQIRLSDQSTINGSENRQRLDDNILYSNNFNLDLVSSRSYQISSDKHLESLDLQIPKKILESESDLLSSERNNNVAGLINLGNSCYINTSLQCLFNCTYFISSLVSNTNNTFISSDAAFSSMLKFIKEMKTKRLVSPAEVKSAIASINSTFNNTDEQDAEEFISTLLDVLHEKLKKSDYQKNNYELKRSQNFIKNISTGLYDSISLSSSLEDLDLSSSKSIEISELAHKETNSTVTKDKLFWKVPTKTFKNFKQLAINTVKSENCATLNTIHCKKCNKRYTQNNKKSQKTCPFCTVSAQTLSLDEKNVFNSNLDKSDKYYNKPLDVLDLCENSSLSNCSESTDIDISGREEGSSISPHDILESDSGCVSNISCDSKISEYSCSDLSLSQTISTGCSLENNECSSNSLTNNKSICKHIKEKGSSIHSINDCSNCLSSYSYNKECSNSDIKNTKSSILSKINEKETSRNSLNCQNCTCESAKSKSAPRIPIKHVDIPNVNINSIYSKKENKNTINGSDDEESEFKKLLDYKESIVSDQFYGMIKHTLQCRECNYKKYKSEIINNLSLSIPNKIVYHCSSYIMKINSSIFTKVLIPLSYTIQEAKEYLKIENSYSNTVIEIVAIEYDENMPIKRLGNSQLISNVKNTIVFFEVQNIQADRIINENVEQSLNKKENLKKNQDLKDFVQENQNSKGKRENLIFVKFFYKKLYLLTRKFPVDMVFTTSLCVDKLGNTKLTSNNKLDKENIRNEILHVIYDRFSPMFVKSITPRHFEDFLSLKETECQDLQMNVLEVTLKHPKELFGSNFAEFNYISSYKKDDITITDCLNDYFMEEEVDLLCEGCNRNTKYTKKAEISRHPKYLMIQFKRFRFSGSGSKINTFVDFPLERLKMKNQYGNDVFYKLISSVNHIEIGLGYGHYLAYIRRNNEWYCCNDSVISKTVRIDKASSYMLFYEMIE